MDLEQLSQFESSKNSIVSKKREDISQFEDKVDDIKSKFDDTVKQPLDIIGGSVSGDFAKELVKKGAIQGLKKLGLSDAKAEALSNLKLKNLIKSPKKTISDLVGSETKGTTKAPIKPEGQSKQPAETDLAQNTDTATASEGDFSSRVDILRNRQQSLLDKLNNVKAQAEDDAVKPLNTQTNAPKPPADSGSTAPIKEDLGNPTAGDDDVAFKDTETSLKDKATNFLKTQAEKESDKEGGSLASKVFKTMAETDAEGGGLEDIGGDVVSFFAGIGALFGGLEAHKKKLPQMPTFQNVTPTYQLGVQ